MWTKTKPIYLISTILVYVIKPVSSQIAAENLYNLTDFYSIDY